MEKTIKLVLILLSVFISTSAANFTQDKAKSFISALLLESSNLINYIDSSEIRYANRLGISYNDVKVKSLISIDIDPAIKEKILGKQTSYTYKIENLEPDYSKLIVEVNGLDKSYEYIFHNDKMISKPGYYSKDWETIVSKYFVFHISNKTLTNDYAINSLDDFVDSMLVKLSCTPEETQKLKKEKIHYLLCKDEKEISKLTGYTARGLYYLADDFIISTFNCHYHEIAHLLINYKLKNLDLYTIPLLQEGFAVAMGGRGGKGTEVILQMGSFLELSNFLDYKMLLSKTDFFQFDASMSYPVAGLYIKFLINTLGMNQFLSIYKDYSGNADAVDKMIFKYNGLYKEADWLNFLSNEDENKSISVSDFDENDYTNLIYKSDNLTVTSNDDFYLFRLKNIAGYKSAGISSDYKSKLFSELFPDKKYNGEQYLFIADSNEVSVYNLLNNNLMAKYSVGFSMDNKTVLEKDGYFIFKVNKDLFDRPLIPEYFVKN